MNSRLKIAVLVWCGLTASSSAALAQVTGYVPEANLVAWYGFNGNAIDDSPNNLSGTAIATEVVTDRSGNPQSAYHFNGVNSEVVIPFNAALNAYPFTVSLWCRREADDNSSILIQHYTNASWNGWVMSLGATTSPVQTIAPGYMLAAPPQCNGVVSSPSCATGINHSANLFDNEWHMLTFTVDGDSGRFYLDGILQTTQAWLGTPGAPTGTSDLRIGGTDLGSNFFFHGWIDDVGIWQRALTPSEVETLYLTLPPIAGCMNSNACNYSLEASIDDGSCVFNCAGCIDPCACNYNQNAVVNDGTCDYSCNQGMSFITVFHDANGNGIYENDETPIQHWPVHFDELNKTVYSDAVGMITVPLPAGTIHYTLLNATDNWISTTPDTYTIEVPGSAVAFFGLMETTPSTQVDASVIESFYHEIHCNNGYESGLFVRNKGSIAAHGTLSLACDPLLTPQAAASLSVAPTSAGAGFATWEIDNLAAWQPKLLAFHIAGPGSEYAGQSFAFSLHLLLYDENGAIVTDANFELTPEVSCEVEDSHLHPSPIGYTDAFHYVHQGERITFRTHFLNTTEATAQDVLVIHNLNSQQFVTDSFELLYTSAAAVGCLHDDGTIDLSFNSIQLPSVTNDPANAIGYAVYSAQLRDDLPTDSTFYHEAYAVFDLSETQLIDSAFHTIYDCTQSLGITGNFSQCEGDTVHLQALVDSALDYSWYVEDSLVSTGPAFSNLFTPGEYTITLAVSNPVCDMIDSKHIVIHATPNADIVLSGSTLTISGADSCAWYYNNMPVNSPLGNELPLMGDGVYRARLFGQGDCESWSNEFVVNNLDVLSREQRCYPNPATHSLYLMSGTAGGSVQLMDMFGRVVWEGVISHRQQLIDVSELARGCYSLVVKTGEQSTIKRIVLE